MDRDAAGAVNGDNAVEFRNRPRSRPPSRRSRLSRLVPPVGRSWQASCSAISHTTCSTTRSTVGRCDRGLATIFVSDISPTTMACRSATSACPHRSGISFSGRGSRRLLSTRWGRISDFVQGRSGRCSSASARAGVNTAISRYSARIWTSSSADDRFKHGLAATRGLPSAENLWCGAE